MTVGRYLLRLFIPAFVLLALMGAAVVAPAAGAERNPVVIYFFWGEGCPNCEAERPVLEELERQFPEVEVRDYEVWFDEDNRQFFVDMAQAYGIEARGVPTTFIGDSVWIGFAEHLKSAIAEKVRSCLESGCPDPGEKVLASTAEQRLPPTAPLPPQVEHVVQGISAMPKTAISVPFLGEIDLASRSLLLTTGLIAFVDGFNPCSLWVLSLLLAIVVCSGARTRILVVGVTFLTVTAAAYGAFIAGLFGALAYMGYLGWIQMGVAVIALVFALINIKDYFWFKQGVSLTISEKHKPKIYKDIRYIMTVQKSLLAMIGATALMALGITLVELPCTAGFPVLWSNIVARHDLDALTFMLLLGLYLVIYLLDELIVFVSVLFTLKASRFEERHGRVLKLIGGMIMLALAVVLLIDPELMNSVGGSLMIFGVALLASLAIMAVHRGLSPRQ